MAEMDISLVVLLCVSKIVTASKITDINQARDFLVAINILAEKEYYANEIAGWNYATNITDYNEALTVSHIFYYQ